MDKLRIGDEFTVRFRVVGWDADRAQTAPICGESLSPCMNYFKEETIALFARDIKRAPVEPKAGQVWRHKNVKETAYKLLFVDDKSVFYEMVEAKSGSSVGSRSSGSRDFFFSYMEFERND
jgi:hypothetical protein